MDTNMSDVIMSRADYYKILHLMGKTEVGRVSFANLEIKRGDILTCTRTGETCVVVDPNNDKVSESGIAGAAISLERFLEKRHINNVCPRKVFTFNGQIIRNMQKVYALLH